MITVMLVDDQAMIRFGLRAIIESDPELSVVAEAADGLAALRSWEQTRPDVILMDIRMPGIDGVRATRQIRALARPEQTQIIVLTTFDEDSNVVAALQAGANGFFSKGVDPADLINGIREVHAGGGALSPAAQAVLINHVATAVEPAVDIELAKLFNQLTPRERDVVAAITRGLDYREIAAELFISPLTAKTHIDHARTKVGARDRAQLVTLAYAAGIRPPA